MVNERSCIPFRVSHMNLSPNRYFAIAMAVCGSGLTAVGLLHVHQGTTDMFAQADGLSGDRAGRLFEDREGNVWVLTSTVR
jgi:hypothetical protein